MVIFVSGLWLNVFSPDTRRKKNVLAGYLFTLLLGRRAHGPVRLRQFSYQVIGYGFAACSFGGPRLADLVLPLSHLWICRAPPGQ